MREDVNQLSTSWADALKYYTSINADILKFNGTLAKYTEFSLFKQKFTVLYTIGRTKEASGIERALLSNAFGGGRFSEQVYNRWIANTAQQETNLAAALTLASDEFEPFLRRFVESDANRKVEAYRQYAKQQGMGDLDRQATEWFAASTLRINELKSVEDILFEEILNHVHEQVSSATWLIILECLLMVGMVLLTWMNYSLVAARREQSQAIRDVMVEVSEQHDLSHEVAIITEDDLGQVARALNLTLAVLREDFRVLQQFAQDIDDASTSTAATTVQTESNIEAERESITANKEAAEALNSGIEDDIASIAQVSSTASEARHSAQEGAGTVASAVTGIKTTADEVKHVGSIIEELNSRVNDILGMVDVIKSVAEQTNLLALNAAIEAARAGEQGRGFAVVADEVRALAQRTQESTEQISNVVDELTASSAKAIQSVEQGNQRAGEAVDMAEQINQILSTVTSNMAALDDIAQVVAQSAQNQRSAVGQMTDEMRNIDLMSQQNTDGAHHIAAAANQLSGIATEMLNQVKRYKV
jgi:methyl-accepting chemotaxis protein